MSLDDEGFLGKPRQIFDHLEWVPQMVEHAREQHDIELANTLEGQFRKVDIHNLYARRKMGAGGLERFPLTPTF